MEITIDTKKDSDDDIRKAIRFLQSLIGESTSQGREFDAGQDVSSGMAGLFGSQTDDYINVKRNDDDNDDDSKIIDSDDAEIQVIPY